MMPSAYYNEHDPRAAAWLRELIAAREIMVGDVDERDIQQVSADDLSGFTHCHFFAGIGGWAEALRLAEWPEDRPVWTGSCPCQPFSAAGKRQGDKDVRHLWPAWFRLIEACRPAVILGEQVASAEVVGTQLEAAFVVAVREGRFARANKLAKQLARSRSFHYWRRWIDTVQADLASASYALRPEVLGAHSVRSPHIRQRLWFVADRAGDGRREERPLGRGIGAGDGEEGRAAGLEPSGYAGLVAEPDGWQPRIADLQRGWEHGLRAEGRCTWEAAERRGDAGELADTEHAERRAQRLNREDGCDRSDSGWAEAHGESGACGEVRELADTERGAAERRRYDLGVAASGFEREARQRERVRDDGRDGGVSSFWSPCDWLPCRDGKARPVEPGTFPLAHGVPARVGRLRGYGNAIVPQVAAEFILAYQEIQGTPDASD